MGIKWDKDISILNYTVECYFLVLTFKNTQKILPCGLIYLEE